MPRGDAKRGESLTNVMIKKFDKIVVKRCHIRRVPNLTTLYVMLNKGNLMENVSLKVISEDGLWNFSLDESSKEIRKMKMVEVIFC